MPIKQKYCFALLATVGIAGAATVADTYVSGIENLVASHRSQTTRLNAPANLTANALLAGGHIFLASNDSSFFYEGSGRSGGIMQMLQYLSPSDLHPGDVAWISYTPGSYQSTLTVISAAQQAGAQVVVFGPQPSGGAPPANWNWVDSLTPWSASDDVSLMGNILSMWSLTGELAAATARKNKTLVFWQSITVPGSAARNAHYMGQLFHSGMPPIPQMSSTIAPGTLSGMYLDYVKNMIQTIATAELPQIIATGQDMRTRALAGNPVTLVPFSHILLGLTYLPNTWYTNLADTTQLGSALMKSGYLVYIGFLGVDLDLWRTVRLTPGAKASWATANLQAQQDFTQLGDRVIDQHWDVGDCTVPVPGYDVCILPASGVAQIFVYELLIQVAGTPPPTASLSVNVTHTGTFTQGQTGAGYTITVSNASGSAPSNGAVTVTDTPPSGLAITGMSGPGWNCSNNSCSRMDALAGGAIYPPISVTVNVASNAPSSVTNQATVSGGGSASASSSDITMITSLLPHLSIQKTHTGSFTQGQSGAVYTIIVSNAAGAAPSNGTITVTDTPPAGLTITGMSGPGWNCSANSCSRADALPAAASYSAITAIGNIAASAPASITNQAAVSGGGSLSMNIGDVTIIAPAPAQLSIQKSHTGSFTQGQSNASYTIVVSNSGGSPTQGAITLTEAPPTGLTMVSLSGSGWTCSRNTCMRSDTLAPGMPYPAVTAVFNVERDASAQLVNTATVSSGGSSPVSATDPTVILRNSPFGTIDVSTNNPPSVSGALSITGWALSASGVSKVSFWREPVKGEAAPPNGLIYVEDAALVPGTRPDVASAFPGYPNNNAGWGAQLLTNELPNSNGSGPLGNGTYQLHVLATDNAAQSTDLGVRTIMADNADAVLPFGTIDTPAPGDTVSGMYVTFGWALTPNQANVIPKDGSTLTVYIDNQPVGHPVYNQYRADIATLFPGLQNSGGAIGYFVIDTTKLTNGLHTISWLVTDNANHTQGIGSRYFNVRN